MGGARVNFERDVLGARDPAAAALVAIDRSGARRTLSFGDVRERAAGLAGTLAALGLRRGDVVVTLAGNRAEWVCAMVGALRSGLVALPCNEQLRAHDLAARLAAVRVAAIVADTRNRAVLDEVAPDCPVLWLDDDSIWRGSAPPHADLAPGDPALMMFTSGTAGEPKCVVHGQRYLAGQALQAEHWMAVRPGDTVWCTAASGWSKSARNAFVAPWLRGGVAVLHDARFDAEERIAVARQEGVNVLCMAPTEYRALVKRGAAAPVASLRECVSAGEPLGGEELRAWREATGLDIRDGYGQTETGQVTAMPPGSPARAGSMGRALPGVRAWIEDGELVVDPATLPTFFLGYAGEAPPDGAWRTGDRAELAGDGYFAFEGRSDDVIISSGYRIGPFEVESALLEHAAVADAAAVAHPDEERGAIVRAFVVLRDGHPPSDALARELQEHVKAVTAPYKYPRRIDFVDGLPRTPSGKVRRSELRERRLDGHRGVTMLRGSAWAPRCRVDEARCQRPCRRRPSLRVRPARRRPSSDRRARRPARPPAARRRRRCPPPACPRHPRRCPS